MLRDVKYTMRLLLSLQLTLAFVRQHTARTHTHNASLHMCLFNFVSRDL